MCRTRYSEDSETSDLTSETCELCNAREAYGTFDVNDVETWVCDYCAVNAVVVDGSIVWPTLEEAD